MTTKTAHDRGIRVQITGPDCAGATDLQGMTGTIIGHEPRTDSYKVGYYHALHRMSSWRPFPADSLEVIDEV